VKLELAIREVEDAENELAKQLRTVGERHSVEHDVYHLGHALAARSGERVRRLEPFAERYGAAPVSPTAVDSPTPLERLRYKGAELLGRTQATGLPLLHDLRDLYLAAQAAEIAWVILAQVARVARDGELVGAAGECREEVEACGKWLRTRIKETCPQVLGTR
jgi:hypothetical protein